MLGQQVEEGQPEGMHGCMGGGWPTIFAHLAWMISVVRYLLKVSGSAERPAVSCTTDEWGQGKNFEI